MTSELGFPHGSSRSVAVTSELADGLPPSVRALRSAFDTAALSLTVGAEEELLLVGHRDDRLAPAARDAIDALGGDDRYQVEFRSSQIELVTRPCLSAADVGRELAAARVDLAEALRGRARAVACGSHPTAYGVGPMTDRDRYHAIARDNRWAARRMLTCGLHVHVALANGDRALAVYNALRGYVPEFAALAANSPFHQSEDSGSSSARLHLNRSLSRHGVPPAFPDWSAYSDFVAWGRAGGAIPDPSYHWWDLRLHPAHGTIEVRACDAQTELGDAVALVGFAQTLVAWLAGRYDRGESLPVYDSYRIAEGLWMAAHTHVHGALLDLETGERESLGPRIGRLLEELAPIASELGTERELVRVALLARRRGADRQRERVGRAGIGELVDWLAERTLASAYGYLARSGVAVAPAVDVADVSSAVGAASSFPLRR